MANGPKTNIIPTYLLSNKDINKLWKILGRISDDPNNEFNLSQDAEDLNYTLQVDGKIAQSCHLSEFLWQFSSPL